MTLDRRQFLSTAAMSLAGTLVPGRATEAAAPTAAPAADLGDWAAVRAQFALSPDYVHMSSFFLSSHPRPVREAIEEHRKAIDANPFLAVDRALLEQRLYGDLQPAAEYLGGKPDEIAFVPNTTTGLAFMYRGLPIKAGQEILTTTHDHYSHHEAIRLASRQAGAVARRIALYDDPAGASEDEIVDRVRREIRPGTRAVGVTWVHSSTGVKLPIRRIASVLADANRNRDEDDRALLIVDGVHGFGVEDETVGQTGCDVFISGTHKWILGPRGTGIIWAPERVWGGFSPTVPTFASLEPYSAWLTGKAPQGPSKAAWITPGGFQTYEYFWALPAAFRFHQQLGRSRIAERIHSLNAQIKEGLGRMGHVQLHTPRGDRLSAGIVCFDVQGMKPGAVVQRLLDRSVIASETPYAPSHARLSASLVNSPDDIERALSAVRELA